MMRIEFDYGVFAMLRMSGNELNRLALLSKTHYDSKCRAASAQGGFLYGFIQQWMMGAEGDYSANPDAPPPDPPDTDREEVFRVSTHQLDTLAKIAEGDGGDDLRQRLLAVLRECGDEYRRLAPKTETTPADQLETRLRELMELCHSASGLPGYPNLNRQRQDILQQVEQTRHLSRWEYICCYGYEQWIAYTQSHGLAESHPRADK